MNLLSTQDQLKELAINDLSSAISTIRTEIKKDSPKYDKARLLEGRFIRVQNEKIMGTRTQSDVQTEENKIAADLVQLIDELKITDFRNVIITVGVSDFSPDSVKKDVKNGSRVRFSRNSILALVAIIMSTTLIFILIPWEKMWTTPPPPCACNSIPELRKKTEKYLSELQTQSANLSAKLIVLEDSLLSNEVRLERYQVRESIRVVDSTKKYINSNVMTPMKILERKCPVENCHITIEKITGIIKRLP